MSCSDSPTPRKPGFWGATLSLLYLIGYCSTKMCVTLASDFHQHIHPYARLAHILFLMAEGPFAFFLCLLYRSPRWLRWLLPRLWNAAEQLPSPATVLTSRGCLLFAHFIITTSISSWRQLWKCLSKVLSPSPALQSRGEIATTSCICKLPGGCLFGVPHSACSFLMVPMPYHTLEPRDLAVGPESGQSNTLKLKILPPHLRQPLCSLWFPAWCRSLVRADPASSGAQVQSTGCW